jgi:hypothetical protein
LLDEADAAEQAAIAAFGVRTVHARTRVTDDDAAADALVRAILGSTS